MSDKTTFTCRTDCPYLNEPDACYACPFVCEEFTGDSSREE